MLTLEDVRKILHISKRKAAWLLSNGIIPCSNTGKKTRQYKVDIEDVIIYIERTDAGEADIRIPTGEFTSSKSKTRVYNVSITPIAPPQMKEWLAYKWRYARDILTIDEAAELTGYSTATVKRWIYTGKLNTINLTAKRVIFKEWLIDYYCGECHQNRQKCSKHKRLLKKYYEGKN